MIGTEIPRRDEAVGLQTATGRFMVIEGLSAVGKSTVAPLVAGRLDADLIETLLPSFDDVRIQVDRSKAVMARLHFWLMCNYAVSEMVRNRLACGRDVVVESYFYRTLATHAAMGATVLPPVDWGRALVPDLTVRLTVDELERRRRMIEREMHGGSNYWSRLEEANVSATRDAYESFELITLDTTGLNADEVASRLAALFTRTVGRRHG